MENTTGPSINETTSIQPTSFVVNQYVLILFMTSLSVTATNALVVLSFFINKTLRKFSNYFIFNLAFSDLIIGLYSTNASNIYLMYDGRWVMGRTTCLMSIAVDYISKTTSALIVASICLDRYIAVSQPLLHREHATNSTAFIVAIVPWLVSILFWIPLIVKYANVLPSMRCHLPFLYSNPLVTVSTTLVTFYLPVVIIIILYSAILRKLKHSESRAMRWSNKSFTSVVTTASVCDVTLHNNSNNSCTRRSKRCPRTSTSLRISRLNKFSLLASAIVGCFILLYLPYNIIVIVEAFCGYRKCVSEVVWILGYGFCYTNSFVNPILYAVFNRNFRMTFKIFFTEKWWKDDVKRKFHLI